VDTNQRLIHMAKSARKPTASAIVNRTVPRRVPNSQLRPREYLTEKEIERLQDAARKRSRYGHRDATMILIAYRHGLRATELCGLRWDQIDLNTGRKGGIDNVHPLSGREIRSLRQLRRENMESRYVFVTERSGPATTAGFLKTIARTGEAAKLPFPIHPHMLRHSTGYKLANDGHDTRALQHYMGHKNIMHTVRYTGMAPDRFKNFWND
jgi:integrase